MVEAGFTLVKFLGEQVMQHIQARVDRNELTPRLQELINMLDTKLQPLKERAESAGSSAHAPLRELEVILNQKLGYVAQAAADGSWKRLWNTPTVLTKLKALHEELFRAFTQQMLVANFVAVQDVHDATKEGTARLDSKLHGVDTGVQEVATDVKALREQLKTLAAKFGCGEPSEGMAEAPGLAAHVERQAAAGAYGPGWAHDPVKILAEKAVSDSDAALEIEPGNVTALATRGAAKRMLDDWEGAVKDCDAALNLDAGNGFAMVTRADAKRMLMKLEEAISDCNTALALNPSPERRTMAFATRGAAKYRLGNAKAAIDDCEKALNVDPNNALARLTRAEINLAKGLYTVVISDCDAALRLNLSPERCVLAFATRGEARRMLGDYEGAIDDCNEALVRNSCHVGALITRGGARCMKARGPHIAGPLALREYKDAISDFDVALKWDPENDVALAARGSAKFKVGDSKGAEEDTSTALIFNLENKTALATLFEIDDAKRRQLTGI